MTSPSIGLILLFDLDSPSTHGVSLNTMREKIMALIRAKEAPVSEERFNDAALRLFRYQFDHNPRYRQFCLSQDKDPEAIQTWEEIPPLPVMAFKLAEISCRPVGEAMRVFQSSGTTGREKSRHALFDLGLAKEAISSHFRRHLLPEGKRIRMAILTPSPIEAPDSSLSHMMEVVRDAVGTEKSRYYIEEGRLNAKGLADDLSDLQEPVALLGTSFSFVHFLDFLKAQAHPLSLPQGSRLMDTGGFKGKSREVPREQLYASYEAFLGLRPENCINEYGMAEMTSQFYDGTVGRKRPRVYTAPPQLRTRLLHPETLQPVQRGEVGLLAHYDLANIDSVMAILTEDLGRAGEGGFVLLGRASGSAAKGCSITLDQLLQMEAGKE